MTEDGTSLFGRVHAFQTDQCAQTTAACLASVIPKISIAGAFPTGLQAISKMAVPDLDFFKIRSPALFLPARMPTPVIARLPPVIDLGFLQGISTMINSWDHGLLRISRDLASAMAAPHQALMRSAANLAAIRANAFSTLTKLSAVSATASLVGLFRAWRETAETGMELLRSLARGAYRAALGARAAVLNGEDEPVVWFIEEWLDMRVTPERIEAVSAALLEEGWDAGVPDQPGCLLTDLRSRTTRQARILRPIWETQINHRTIGRLDHTVTTNGKLLTVADMVRDPQTTEDLALANECEEQRIPLVLSRLKPDELRVAKIYAQLGEPTWAEAARLADAPDPEAMGERVRRKLKRLGAEHHRRLIQAGAA